MDFSYSTTIANAISDTFDANDWRYRFDEEKGVFTSGASIRGKLQNVRSLIYVHEDGYLSRAVCPIKADVQDKEVMRNIADFLHKANYDLRNGGFEFDNRDGEVSYKTYNVCIDRIPKEEEVMRSVFLPAMMFEKYTPGILGILFGGMDAESAYALCMENID